MARIGEQSEQSEHFDRPTWRSQSEHTPLGVFALFRHGSMGIRSKSKEITG
jgi:hypothetical protein